MVLKEIKIGKLVVFILKCEKCLKRYTLIDTIYGVRRKKEYGEDIGAKEKCSKCKGYR